MKSTQKKSVNFWDYLRFFFCKILLKHGLIIIYDNK